MHCTWGQAVCYGVPALTRCFSFTGVGLEQRHGIPLTKNITLGRPEKGKKKKKKMKKRRPERILTMFIKMRFPLPLPVSSCPPPPFPVFPPCPVYTFGGVC
ncbi:hypothetical protein FKM82_022037 [Ascaphus truei]